VRSRLRESIAHHANWLFAVGTDPSGCHSRSSQSRLPPIHHISEDLSDHYHRGDRRALAQRKRSSYLNSLQLCPTEVN
jgi:hypothetical protein